MISFVIPAHNEEAYLPVTLRALLAAAEQLGRSYEVIVVNDASTDNTGPTASQFGARVIDVSHRNIAATRNSGVWAATGDLLFFVDADTQASMGAITAGITALEQGAVGGGCHFLYDGEIAECRSLLRRLADASR
jgi:glycosyltransferase involved in cell wall biosynthesis